MVLPSPVIGLFILNKYSVTEVRADIFKMSVLLTLLKMGAAMLLS